ncbi:hypothetical protein LXT21_28545 [Myxococcus sp. K38C18041901]|uniref:hypothetical protein n=1 Tax=Myxococcus guangdongensis TaxID=2906760 RepID=UPI0020A78E72|nr:hypothetical protein [Myxococcus guangdongensis]MCP3062741.1 hypothetical protein [Myxococcus guangdongensis]
MSLPSQQPQTIDPMPPVDAEAIQQAAVQAFVEWTRRLPVPPPNPKDFIRAVEPKARRAARLYSVITERQVVWKKGAPQGSPDVTGLRRQSDSVDPWAETHASLRESSLSILACSPCGSRGTVSCPNCAGREVVQCSNCGGSRKAYGHASNGSRRLMNCRSCSAKGTVPCPSCRSGRVNCSACHGRGREQHWLEFVESVRFDFLVLSEEEELRRLVWTKTDMEKDAKLVGDISANGVLAQEKVSLHLPEDWVHQHWGKTQVKLKPRERITSQSFQVFEVPAARVSYSIADAPPTTIEFEGQRMLAPPPSADRQFTARGRKVQAVRGLLLALALGIPLLYILRGAYFWNGLLVFMSVFLGVSAILAEHFVRDWTLGRKGRARGWGIGAAVSALPVTVLAMVSEPSLQDARQHMSEGRLDDAQTELQALGEPESPELQQAWADLHLAHALREQNVDEVVKDALAMAPNAPERAKVEQHLLSLTRQQALASLERKDVASASTVLASAQPVLARSFSRDLGELTARLHDTEHAACSTDPCRWKALFAAYTAQPTPSRERLIGQLSTALQEQLTPKPRPKAATLDWVLHLHKTTALAAEMADTPHDPQVSVRANQALTWAREEREQIPLIGAEREVAIALLQLTASSHPNILSKTTESVSLSCELRDGRCVGAYLAGSDKESRVLNNLKRTPVTKELLSRVLGHPVELPAPPQPRGGKPPTQTTWKDGRVTLVARWNGIYLMELRVGEVKP